MVLIPNIHLETPNYTVTRLRHDDLNQSEPLAPSYEMVPMPTDEDKSDGEAEAGSAAELEAAVKGITPQQPAPMRPAEPAPARRRRTGTARSRRRLDHRQDHGLVPPQALGRSRDRRCRSTGTQHPAPRRTRRQWRSWPRPYAAR